MDSIACIIKVAIILVLSYFRVYVFYCSSLELLFVKISKQQDLAKQSMEVLKLTN
jgi:hypothetical protein